ncbi:hypothetical protein HPP92_027830 [Vanilla planifolia]|uniref:Glycerol-3-phosphate acyltransferase RAM2/GPAT1-8 HAD-like domain-containing protein n=1 Tax=Vanilla planifolia TaxID=51239 RepID=A0A835PAC2_VANPL|nr:hypothetical protein HPP92_027830 [Vanilla planifolia]
MAEKSEPFFFPTISSCSSDNRETHTVVTDLDGGLLLEESSFPTLLSLPSRPEASSASSSSFSSPLSPSFSATFFPSPPASASSSLPPLPASNSRASTRWRSRCFKVLRLEVRADAWRVFSACGRRGVVTASPRVMVEPFARDYLGADVVVGS